MNLRLATPEPRTSLFLLLAALLASAALLAFGLYVHQDRARAASHDEVMEHQARIAARAAPRRLELDKSQAELHGKIQRIGFLAEEDRAGWISALGRVREELSLDSLVWRLGPRSSIAGTPGLQHSHMDLTINRINAANLSATLNRLAEVAPGRFTVEGCALSFDNDGKHGQAECRLAWWTWNDPAAPR